jgi:hypothetical protein
MPPTPLTPDFIRTTPVDLGMAGIIGLRRQNSLTLVMGNFSSGPIPPTSGQCFPTGK